LVEQSLIASKNARLSIIRNMNLCLLWLALAIVHILGLKVSTDATGDCTPLHNLLFLSIPTSKQWMINDPLTSMLTFTLGVEHPSPLSTSNDFRSLSSPCCFRE
jgi:hypothetical protein